jgi:hypothetical protein
MIHDDILRFDISVSDSSVLQIFNCLSQVSNFLSSITFLKFFAFTVLLVMEKTPLLQILHN